MDVADISQSDLSADQRNRDVQLDLGLDPSDPLNLLLHNNSNSGDSSMEDMSTSSSGGSPPQWSQLSSLWPPNSYMEQGGQYVDGGIKYPDLGVDLNMSFPIDMDFKPSMAVNPNSLHFDYARMAYPLQPSDYNQYGPLSNELLSASFPFTFSADHAVPNFAEGNAKPRRLSMTSSSSSSGASLSPVLGSGESVRSSAHHDDGADELAERVRKSAGVMVAVSGGQGQSAVHSLYIHASTLPGFLTVCNQQQNPNFQSIAFQTNPSPCGKSAPLPSRSLHPRPLLLQVQMVLTLPTLLRPPPSSVVQKQAIQRLSGGIGQF
jgi:hypothetical protein